MWTRPGPAVDQLMWTPKKQCHHRTVGISSGTSCERLGSHLAKSCGPHPSCGSERLSRDACTSLTKANHPGMGTRWTMRIPLVAISLFVGTHGTTPLAQSFQQAPSFNALRFPARLRVSGDLPPYGLQLNCKWAISRRMSTTTLRPVIGSLSPRPCPTISRRCAS